ncbi:acyltransferase family protein [Phreatobacter aquaticus]|nr:acyltransferase [Phreatobacter aquaticus]
MVVEDVPTAAPEAIRRDSRDLEGADAVRFWAALVIVLYHALLLPGLEPPGSFPVIRNFGGFGVPLFFTLSAFVLCFGYHGRLETAAAMRAFYWRRLFRIAPLFYVVGAVSLAFFYVAYDRVVGVADILTSATFTFGLFPQHYTGFVWASWSIGVEMLFYAVFPILALVVRTWRSATVAFIASTIIAALWAQGFKGASADLQGFASLALPAKLPYFCGGMLAFFAWHAIGDQARWRTVLLFVSLAAIGAMIHFAVPVQMLSGRMLGWDHSRAGMIMLWALVLGILTIGMGFSRFNRPWLAWTATLGKASFGLYLWHPLLIGMLHVMGAYRFLYAFAPATPGFGYVTSAAMTLTLLVPLALASYRWVERPGLALARRGDSQRDAPSPAAVSA